MSDQPSGFLLIDKPVDWTSHDIVAKLRGITKIKKIGHAGTLDPFATGLLIVGVGRAATRRLDEFKGMAKTYETTAHLGATSDTQDLTGEITPVADAMTLTDESITEAIKTFIGPQEQTPPMYSAKKVGGKKLYDLARAGKEIERSPVSITIHDIVLGEIALPTVSFTTTVSAGTYIRTLCHDLGDKLGVGGYCESLRRTNIGDFRVENALSITKETTREDIINALQQL